MILVTGGTGLVGSHLLYELVTKNKKVRAIYRTNKSKETVLKIFSYYSQDALKLMNTIDWVEADITDIPSLEAAFKEVTHVYHCAAVVSFDPKKYRTLRQVNIEGTANIVNCCIKKNITKLCYISSIATLGNMPNNPVHTEENEWNKEDYNSGYAITKHGAEMEVWRGSQEGIDMVIVNPGVILGPGIWDDNTGEFFSKTAKGFKFYTEGTTGFVGVYDVVRAMCILMDSTVINERFVLVSENKSYREIANSIAGHLKVKPPNLKASKLLTAIFWRLNYLWSKLTGAPQVLTKNTAASLHSKTAYSSKKIVDTGLFSFTPVEKDIERICSYYQADNE
ncbi:NAD-dependent epimerase [Polaribacter pacificus]|uniref:NAD-dependent epimerase n=1 Tax=Polaribacter pacificus TaxID=1775173 RepID=A0A917HVF9_9FLAO|nr:NAD-dependent epimerase/dehydratase family protein [Polaribacter pacificus]GGG92770.1 NAD-dependent epimerase [Polaribacter pacificus]